MNVPTLTKVIIGAVAAAVTATIAVKLFGGDTPAAMGGAIGGSVGGAVAVTLASTGSGKKKE